MPTHVDVPGQGVIEFPDGMSDDDISNVIKTKLMPSQSNVLINSQSRPDYQLGSLIPQQQPRQDNYAGKGDDSAWTRPLVPVSLINNPQTIGEGLVNSLGKAVASITSPLAVATAPLMMAKPLQIPLMGAFAGMGAHGVGQGLGEQFAGPLNGLGLPTPTPGLNSGQRAEGFGDIASQALMAAAPVAHVLSGFSSPLTTGQGPVPINPDVQGSQAFRSAQAMGTLTPPPVAKDGNLNTPNPFDKGVVMPNSPEVISPPAKIPAPLSDLQQYQAVQQEMAKHDFGSPEFAAAWAQNEVIKNRNGGMPPTEQSSESSQPSINADASQTPVAVGITPPTVTPSSPVTFKPAVRVGDEIVEGQHGAAAQLAYQRAQQKGIAQPKVEHGFVGSDNQWYASPMEVSRKIQEQNANTSKAEKQQQGNVERSADTTTGQQATGQGGEEVSQLQTGKDVPSVPEGENVQAHGTLPKEESRQQSGDARTDEQVGNAKQPRQLSKEEQATEQKRLNDAVNGESGFILMPKGTWDKVGFEKGVKIDPQQMFNRVRNVLGEGSETWKWLQNAGLQSFLSMPRTKDEVQKWAEDNAPKVEVRKFANKANDKQAVTERSNVISHELETLGYSVEPNEMSGDAELLDRDGNSLEGEIEDQPQRVQELFRELAAMPYDHENAELSNSDAPHWQSIAPKSERDMPGYVEIAVVKPHNDKLAKVGFDNKDSGIQFPSSHNFPPNTLGFVRGYMENFGGKKVFHVIEVQSDWAQQHRDIKSQVEANERSNYPNGQLDKAHLERIQDPFLPHYERLALKAAIEHARSEGATHIALSDAETAMMTEGHDRGARERTMQDPMGNPDEKVISQEPGMHLHYDQTLPKILGELTGGKGERVEMGDNKNAMEGVRLSGTPGERIGANEPIGYQPRKDLIFRNPDGTPKTSVSGRMYEIGKKNPTPTFSHFGKDKGEAGSIINPATLAKEVFDEVRQKITNLKDTGKNILDAVSDSSAWKAAVLKRQGYDLSRIESVSPKLANVVARYANSGTAALLRGQANLNEVFRDKIKDEQFRKQLGGVIYEDMRQGSGGIGNSVLSLKNSPFKDQAQLDAAKKNPDIIAALNRWKALIQKPATEMHQKLNGGVAAVGKDTGAFANLIAVMEDKDATDVKSSPSVGPLATMKKGSAFSRERKFSGEEYNLDAHDMGMRMMTKNDAEFQKRAVYEEMEKQGLGKLLKPGEEAPAEMVRKPNPVTLRSIVTKNADGTIESASVSRYPAWDKRIDSEMEQALQLNTSWKSQMEKNMPLVYHLAQLAIKTQVAAGIDLGFHTANDMIAVAGSGKGLLALPQKAVASLKAINDIVTKNPKLTEEMAKAAEQGVTFRGTSLGGWSSKILQTVDTVARTVLNREYDDLVKAKMVVDSPAERRRYINGRAGQYNKRFMTYFDQTMQETGVAPFVVAGKNFNRLALGAITMSPGVKAASGVDALRMRISIAAGIATLVLAAPALVNIAVTGQAKPDGFEYGDMAIPRTKNPDGTMKKLDMKKWSLVDRAGRVTGLSSLIKDQIAPRFRGEQPTSLKQTGLDMAKNVLQSKTAPYAGPPLNIVSTLATGKSATGFEQRSPGEKAPYVQAAVGALNPLIGGAVNDTAPAKTMLGQMGKTMLAKGEDILGVANSKSPLSVIYQQANRFKSANNIPINSSGDAPSQYIPLKTALANGDIDTAKKAYQDLVGQVSKQYLVKDTPDEATKKAMKVVQQEFSRLENFRFINKDDEAVFQASLTPPQREMYKTAVAQQKQLADTFFSQVQAKIEVPKKGPFQLNGLNGIKDIKGF